jgi:hypothetical protein
MGRWRKRRPPDRPTPGTHERRRRGVAPDGVASLPTAQLLRYASTTQVPAMRSNQPRLRLSTRTQMNPM